MTLDEARAIGQIASTADGGCSTCAGHLVDRLNKAFPAFVWTLTREAWFEQPDWSDDPEDKLRAGDVVEVSIAQSDNGAHVAPHAGNSGTNT